MNITFEVITYNLTGSKLLSRNVVNIDIEYLKHIMDNSNVVLIRRNVLGWTMEIYSKTE